VVDACLAVSGESRQAQLQVVHVNLLSAVKALSAASAWRREGMELRRVFEGAFGAGEAEWHNPAQDAQAAMEIALAMFKRAGGAAAVAALTGWHIPSRFLHGKPAARWHIGWAAMAF